MDFGPFRRLALELNFDAHGVAVTFTRPAPNDTPIQTTGIWQGPEPEDQPVGTQFRARDPRRFMALRRDQVPFPELGSLVVAPENIGGTPKNWYCDGTSVTESDYQIVILTTKVGT